MAPSQAATLDLATTHPDSGYASASRSTAKAPNEFGPRDGEFEDAPSIATDDLSLAISHDLVNTYVTVFAQRLLDDSGLKTSGAASELRHDDSVAT